MRTLRQFSLSLQLESRPTVVFFLDKLRLSFVVLNLGSEGRERRKVEQPSFPVFFLSFRSRFGPALIILFRSSILYHLYVESLFSTC